ncbi:MAG: DUF6850 family outer membrane beta-barrel protein [Syntrophothermus sp.]
MKKILLLITLILSTSAFSQQERLSGMGYLDISIPDKYHTFNPYDLGNNPAWLVNDETNSFLKIIPSFSGYDGTYRRYYDAAGENLYKLKFAGLKTLKSGGTFYGETSYEYDFRRSVNRSLRYNTYGGQAFFIADTTAGNFRYMGPLIKFAYSYEPINKLYAGASIKYRILDGLKYIYSRAEVLYREIETNVGVAYNFDENYSLGLNYTYLNDQENIESKSEDLLDVELYEFRGEKYAILKRGSTINQKIKGSGHEVSLQFYQSSELMETGLAATYRKSNQKVLIPFTLQTQSFNEYEEGYSSFSSASLELKSRYHLTNKVSLALTAGYFRDYVWSKNTAKIKTLWEWEINNFVGGAGLSWKINNNFIAGIEYNYSNINADSSKYIDSRFFKENFGNHFIKAGAEYQILENIFARAGYNMGTIKKDILYGAENISINKITAGLGLYTFSSFTIDIQLEYGFYSGLPNTLKRAVFSGYSTIKLFTF